MTEHISLELAKEIAEKYEQLGVEAPKAKRVWGQYTEAHKWGLIYVDGVYPINQLFQMAFAYTAAEILSALPVRTIVFKSEEGYKIWHWPEVHPAIFNHTELVEALGLMLCRVLDEQIREKGGDNEEEDRDDLWQRTADRDHGDSGW